MMFSPGLAIKVVVYHQRTYLTCSNYNFVLMYYVLVNKVNNEIYNLLQFTILLTENAHLYILSYLNKKNELHLS